jgi:hypothetical protein
VEAVGGFHHQDVPDGLRPSEVAAVDFHLVAVSDDFYLLEAVADNSCLWLVAIDFLLLAVSENLHFLAVFL